MAGNLKVSSVKAPAFMGINTQESEVTLSEGYATQANNCIIDRYGRLGSRRGWVNITTNNADLLDTEEIGFIYEYKDVDGNIDFLCGGGGTKLFTGYDVLVDKTVRNTADTGDVSYSITTDNWIVGSLGLGAGSTGGAEAYLAQANHPILCYSKAATLNNVYRRLGDVGSVPTGYSTTDFDPDCITTAYGRLWAANTASNKFTVYYSRLLAGHHFSGVGSGVLDVSSVVGNNDEIVALAGYNGNLIIFCKNNIIVYANADNPTQLSLVDTIQGVGCIARDSVQKCGEDLVFLSKSGLRSLRRTIQEKSMPMRELSMNIRDELIDMLQGIDYTAVKGIYYERDAFYLLLIPTLKRIICFDMRVQLENGASRPTYWTNMLFKCFATTEDNKLLFGSTGGIAKYFGYTDNGNSYRMTYFTSNSDVGLPSILKILKKAKMTLISDEAQDFVFKYSYNYSTDFTSRTIQKEYSQGLSEYNMAEYNIGEYTGGIYVTQVSVLLGGHGDIIKFGIETQVNGAPVSIQRIDVYYKSGRLS